MSIKKLKRVVIKEELVALTGKVNEAIVLNQMIYWSERVKDSDKFVKEELDRARKFADGSTESLEEIKETLESGWIYKKSDEMIEETMLGVSRKTMDRIFESLVKNEWLDRRRNPKYKWDKTWQYRVNLNKIQTDLFKLGYNLEGYSLPEYVDSKIEDDPSKGQYDDSIGHHDHTEGQIELSKGQNNHTKGQHDDLRGHHDPAIPEITSQITTDNTSENLSIIKNNILKLNLPTPIQKQLILNMDRLIDDSINLEDIEFIYHAMQNEVNEYQFSLILSNVLSLTKGKIKNIKNLLHKAIINFKNDVDTSKSYNPKGNDEIIPSWFEDRKRSENNKAEKQQQTNMDLEKEKQKLKDLLEKNRDSEI